MPIFDCTKCGTSTTSNSQNPRCSKCNSSIMVLHEEMPRNPVIQTVPLNPIPEKEFKQLMNARILEHFDKMSGIQLLNAMSQGIVTKSPELAKQENDMARAMLESLQQSNETLVDSLADVKQTTNEITAETKDKDALAEILQFAKENPDMAKEFIKNLNSKDSTVTNE